MFLFRNDAPPFATYTAAIPSQKLLVMPPRRTIPAQRQSMSDFVFEERFLPQGTMKPAI